MPPLRVRGSDVLTLANMFLKRFALENHKRIDGFTDKARAKIVSYRWPGNVRELENAIEHAVVMARKDTIVPGDLPFGRESPDADAAPLDTGDDADSVIRVGHLVDLPYPEAKRRAVEEFERAFLRNLLKRTGGNVSEAARQSGLDRSNFRRALKRARVK